MLRRRARRQLSVTCLRIIAYVFIIHLQISTIPTFINSQHGLIFLPADGDQKKPPPIRGEGLLRGTTLLASLVQDCPVSVKPLWTALTGDSRHRLFCSNPTRLIVGSLFTSGVCQFWRSRRVQPDLSAPRTLCWARTSLSQLAVGWFTTPARRDLRLLNSPAPIMPVLIKNFQTEQEKGFVDPEGFEPSTSSMPLRRAPNCAMGPNNISCRGGCCFPASGPGGIRTRDLFSAIEARSHCATGPG